ncbi:hypothetical protein BJI47_02905 [Rhodococcus sp. 1168]|nr:hypothetical protein BJI47_02905 [Rhodococcus sp. 1168]
MVPAALTETLQCHTLAQVGHCSRRVDARIQIYQTTGANKRSIYVHFGPKEELFDLVVARTLAEMPGWISFRSSLMMCRGIRVLCSTI